MYRMQWGASTFPTAAKESKDELSASFEDKRRIIELLVEEVIVTNGKVEIVHIIPLEKKGNLQLHHLDGFSRICLIRAHPCHPCNPCSITMFLWLIAYGYSYI